MRHGISKVVGAAIGILVALIAIDLLPSPRAEKASRAMLSECDGAIARLVIQYVSGDTIARPVYQSFLPQLPSDVTVHVVCPDSESFEELATSVGKVQCTLRALVVNRPMTVWSRDRWLAVREAGDRDVMTLLAPRHEAGAEIWPERAGDARIVADLARSLAPDVRALRLPISFDGGDLLADDSVVFVTPALERRNVGQIVATSDDLCTVLERELGKRVALLEDAPDHHAGMFMMAAGNRTMLVGDPSLAKALLGKSFDLAGGADFFSSTQQRFDTVAEQVAAEGYHVVRIPTAISTDGRTYLTYVNGIIDCPPDGRRIVYMPTYRGAEALNEAAAEVWRGLGYEVRPVDCTSSYRHFGNLHCLVNVLERRGPAGSKPI